MSERQTPNPLPRVQADHHHYQWRWHPTPSGLGEGEGKRQSRCPGGAERQGATDARRPGCRKMPKRCKATALGLTEAAEATGGAERRHKEKQKQLAAASATMAPDSGGRRPLFSLFNDWVPPPYPSICNTGL
jgi:hypothetical protein